MGSIVQTVASLAQYTFSKSVFDESFPGSFSELAYVVDELRDYHFNISPKEILNEVDEKTGTYSPAVIGIDIEKNYVFSMAMFLIRDGCKITLHDHRNMHGVLKTIYGTVKVTSYTVETEPLNEPVTPEDAREIRQPNCLIPVDLCMSAELTSNNRPAVFTPTTGNFHEICAVGGVAVVFDILSPSYGVANCCNQKFYRVIETKSSNKKKIWLCETYPGFKSEKATYKGPKISL